MKRFEMHFRPSSEMGHAERNPSVSAPFDETCTTIVRRLKLSKPSTEGKNKDAVILLPPHLLKTVDGVESGILGIVDYVEQLKFN